MNMRREKEICAIIDAQGFFIRKTFYPREISIVNNEYQICFEILPEINVDTKVDNFKQFSIQQHQLHGIPVQQLLEEKTKRVFCCSQLRQIVEEIYFRVRTENKKLLGVKNQQVATLLKEYQIPFFNFETEEVGGEVCPTLSTFDKFSTSIFCPLHAVLKRKLNEQYHRCALRKASMIWDWLDRKINSDLLVDEILRQSESALTHLLV